MASPILMSWFPWGNDSEDPVEEPESEEPESEEISDRELRKQAFKAEQEINQLDKKIEGHRKQYKEHLQKGANAPEHRRRVLAIKARMQKFKGQLRQIERKKSVRNLMKLELKRGEQEVQSLAREVGTEGEQLAQNISIDEEEFQDNITDAQASIHADMQKAQETMEALQMPNGNFEMGTSEEEQIMEDLAKGDAAVDEIDLGSPDVVDTEDTTEASEWDVEEETGF